MSPRRNLSPLMSTGKDDWVTPPDLYAHYHRHYQFGLDLAATAENTLCVAWLGPGSVLAEDALTVPWDFAVAAWCNPPYGAIQKAFIAKAAQEATAPIVMLLPARTDTVVFHRYIWNRDTRRPHEWVRALDFLKGRLTFVGATAPAPFPSMVVTFGRNYARS